MRSLWVSVSLAVSISFVQSLAATVPQAAVSLYAWEDVEGVASWYSRDDPGVTPWTANAERFDDQALTCAIWGAPFDARLRVTNLANGRSIIVRVNDRGPAERLILAESRIIDLTKTAFATIANPVVGLIRVRVELISGAASPSL